jgi:hypothetical protein
MNKYKEADPTNPTAQWDAYCRQNLANNTNPAINGDNKKPAKDMDKFWAEQHKDLMT